MPAIPRPARIAGALAASAAIVLVTSTAADAHVTVTAPGVTVGASDAQITFRVPTESARAATVGVRIEFPLDHPIAGVLVQPKPGWTVTLRQKKLARPIVTDDGDITQVVAEVDWTAKAGNAVPPGFFGDFTVIGGKLPDDVDALTFRALQRYSNGRTVKWIETAAPGSDVEPEFPAPVLDLTPAEPANSTAGGGSGTDTTGIIGIVVGAVGVVLGGAALALSRRRG